MSYEGFGNGGDGRPPAAAATGLARQSSIYSLTLGEFQHTLEGLGKDFGSMNMDEFLKSIWFAEETQAIASAAGFGGDTSSSAAAAATAAAGASSGTAMTATGLQRQGSLTLPRTISLKTVDEVWRDIAREETSSVATAAATTTAAATDTSTNEQKWQTTCSSTYGEMTLEEFLVKAGVVREEASTVTDGGVFGGFPIGGDNRAFARIGAAASAGNGVAMVVEKAGASPGQQQTCYDTAVQVVSSGFDICGGAGDAVAGTGVGGYAGGSPSSSGDLMLPSSSCGFSKGQGRRTGGVEKAVERRQKRMIKNRESAARSRARKQAYTMELEAEVAKLKERNQELMTKQAKILEMQKKQILESSNNQEGSKKRKLRRTQTGPW